MEAWWSNGAVACCAAHLILYVGSVEPAFDEQGVLQLEQLYDAGLNCGGATGLREACAAKSALRPLTVGKRTPVTATNRVP